MIKKAREKSIRLLTMEAGGRRVYKNHPVYAQIERELGRQTAGYKGECALDYYLTFLPDDKYFIFHGLRIKDPKNRHFQMDTFLFSLSHGLILESKYISGELEFDEKTSLLIRKVPEGHETMGDPISQVERHKEQLRSWMEKHLGKVVPITGQVVLTNKNAILLNASPIIMKKVTFLTNLPNRMKSINENLPNPILSEKELRKAARMLNQKHAPDQFDFMGYFKLSQKEMITGVICPECSHSPMIRKSANWICLECGCKSKNAHIEALQDYTLLCGKSISNKQAKEFLHLSSSSVTFQILQSMNLRHTGTKKGRVYFLD